jgi:hypothetical protein
MRLPVLCSLLTLTLLAGCASTPPYQAELGGYRVTIGDRELKQDLKGRRVVDMYGVQGLPLFESWSPEIEERMTAVGEQAAAETCGGPAELVSLSRSPFAARSASLRYHCL